MSQISTIEYSDVKEAQRFDADYFKPLYLDVENTIRTHNYSTLGKISKLFVKGIFDINSEVYTDVGVPFVRISNLKNLQIDDSNIVYIPEEENSKNKKTELKYGDLILSKTAYPACSLVTLDRCNTSQDTIAIKLKDDSGILSKFLVVFLNTKYGLSQMKRYFTGNIQMHLNLTESKQILVPILSEPIQDKVGRLFDSSIQKQNDSKKLYKEAEEILLKEIGLDQYKIPRTHAYETTSKKVCESERFDAEYFQPKYEEIIKKIERYENGCDILRNRFHLINGKTPEQYLDTESDIQILKTKQIRNEALRFEDVAYTTKDFIGEVLQERDVLFASMGVGSLGRAGIFYSFETDKKTGVDSTIKILRKKGDFEPEVLQTFLNSVIGQEYVYRYIVGSTGIISIKNLFIENLKIPLIKTEIQKQIAQKIQESHKLRKESKELLEEAKRKVEQEIEKTHE